MFKKIAMLTTALNALALSAVAAQHGTCDSILKLSLHSEGEITRIDAKNASGKLIAAYVVVAEPKSSDNAHRSTFQGKFTDSSLLQPGSSIHVGSITNHGNGDSIHIDYVRVADGTTCGKSETDEAKSLSESFRTP